MNGDVNMIYLDNSATTYPKPSIVRQNISKALLSYGANPGRGGYKMGTDTNELVFKTRKALSDFFNAGGEENIIFTGSCTMAINQVLFGKLSSGDHIIVSDVEHNAVMRPIYALEKLGVEYSVAETFPSDNDKTLMSFRSKIKDNTKLVICTAASNVFGFRLPIERIAALCHIYNIEICVDAAQGAGIFPINSQLFDYLCMPGHKGLLGPMGIGVLITKKGSSLKPFVYGGTGVNSASHQQPDETPERLESGTVNVPGIAGVLGGVSFINSVGIDKLRKEEMNKIGYIYNEMKKIPNVKLYTDFPKEPYFVPVLSFNIGEDTDRLTEFYGKNNVAVRGGLHCAPSAHNKMGTVNGTVRISPSYFTKGEEINSFLRITRSYKI